LASVRRWGGVLEHPAESKAWPAYGLAKPSKAGGWSDAGDGMGYVCEVWQSAYGHLARKRTWLYFVGVNPTELLWEQKPGTHQSGGFDRKKRTLAGKAASATPPAFAEALVDLVRGCCI